MNKRAQELRVEISRLIKQPTVLQHLVPGIISPEDGREIKRLYELSTERANHRLLDVLLDSEVPGKWVAFQQALKDSNYPYLASLLNAATPSRHFQQQKYILEVFAPYLEQEINPRELTTQLYQNGILEAVDIEEIDAEQKNKGAIAATMILLDRIQTRLPPEEWFDRFLTALSENGQKHLVEKIDPDFIERQEKGQKLLENAGMYQHDDVVSSSRTNTVILKNIEKYRSLLTTYVDLASAIDFMVSFHLVSFETRNQLLETNSVDPKKAMADLIKNITFSNKGEEFVQCLQQAEYSYLSRLLVQNHPLPHDDRFDKVLNIFSTSISSQLETNEILSCLVQKMVINARDLERILARYNQKGRTAAAMMLLDCVPCRLSPVEWYPKFLEALMETSHGHIVEKVEPDFFRCREQFMLKLRICKRMHTEDETAVKRRRVDDTSDLDKDVKLIEKRLTIYKNSKTCVADRIKTEKERMQLSVESRFDELRSELDEKEKIFETAAEVYKSKLLVLKARERNTCQNEIKELREEISKFNRIVELDVEFNSPFNMPLTSLGRILEVNKCLVDNEDTETTQSEDAPVETTDSKSKGSSYLKVSGIELDEELEVSDTEVDHSEESPLNCTETLDAKEIPLRKMPNMSEMISLPNKLVGLCSEEDNILIIDPKTFTILKAIRVGETTVNRIAWFDKNVILGWAKDSCPISIIGLDQISRHKIEWECIENKLALVAHQNSVFVLCSGKHLHVFQIDEMKHHHIDLFELPCDREWNPTYAAVNDDCSLLFTSDEDSVYCFRISMSNVRTKRPGKCLWTYQEAQSPENSIYVRGLSFIQGCVVVLDSNNHAIMILNTIGMSRAWIERLEFSSNYLALVAFDISNATVHLVSQVFTERQCREYRVVRLLHNNNE